MERTMPKEGLMKTEIFFCSNCGVKLSQDSLFCENWGAQVRSNPEKIDNCPVYQDLPCPTNPIPPSPFINSAPLRTDAPAPTNTGQYSGNSSQKPWRLYGAVSLFLGSLIELGEELFRYISSGFLSAESVAVKTAVTFIVSMIGLLAFKSFSKRKLTASIILCSLLIIIYFTNIYRAIGSIQFYAYNDLFLETLKTHPELKQSEIFFRIFFLTIADIIIAIGAFIIVLGGISSIRTTNKLKAGS